MTQTRMTRRHALRFPPILAAALALPLGNAAAEATEPAEPEIVHPAMCFHDKYRSPVTAHEYIEAEHRFSAMLSPAQYSAWRELENLHFEHRVSEEDSFIDELCRHFPGLAPAIRAVAYHVMDTRFVDRGSCCDDDEDDDTGGAA
jgi:hypothetical protein